MHRRAGREGAALSRRPGAAPPRAAAPLAATPCLLRPAKPACALPAAQALFPPCQPHVAAAPTPALPACHPTAQPSRPSHLPHVQLVCRLWLRVLVRLPRGPASGTRLRGAGRPVRTVPQSEWRGTERWCRPATCARGWSGVRPGPGPCGWAGPGKALWHVLAVHTCEPTVQFA